MVVIDGKCDIICYSVIYENKLVCFFNVIMYSVNGNYYSL